MEDTSLEDFLESGSGEERETAEREDVGAASGAGDAVDDGSGTALNPPAPPAVTASWTPAGDACADCGNGAEWRWRDEVGLVCPDCKDW